MSKREVPFFLPIRRETMTSLMREGTLPTAGAEQAGVMAIAMLRRTPQLSVHHIERALFEVQDLVGQEPSVVAGQIKAAWLALPPISIEELEQLLDGSNMVFAPSSRFLFADEPIETYDSRFQQDMQIPTESVEVQVLPIADDDSEDADYYDGPTPSRPVVAFNGSHQQTLALRVIVSMLDEHVDADAYAGTGKTHLIMALAASAPAAFTYVTPHSAHMHGGLQSASGLASALRKSTLFDLAVDAAKPFFRAKGIRWHKFGIGEVQPSQRAQLAGIDRIGQHSAAQVVSLVERAIGSWCNSESAVIGVEHFKRVLNRSTDVRPYVVAAQTLWAAMWAPGQTSAPFTRNLTHLVKWLNLLHAPIPISYGTLLVDEAHDLPSSWRHFLDRYSGGCVFLGDPYQRLQGRLPRHNRNKSLVISQSFRMGLQGDHAVRRALACAPEQQVFERFEGARSHITRVRHEPELSHHFREGLRVYANEWALLEDAQRLKSESGRFRILPATIRDLRVLVKGAVILFTQHAPSWRLHAGGYRVWPNLAKALEQQGRQKVIRLFERGYNVQRFEEMLDSQSPEGAQKITLGLVAHVKNLESSSVTLNECCFSEAQARHGYLPSHAIYLAMSRVRDELWLPADGFDRLAELKVGSDESLAPEFSM